MPVDTAMVAGWLDAYGLGPGTPVEGLPALVTQ